MEEIGNRVYKADGATEPIDIIVPTHGRLEDLTIPCINAIYANTRNLFHLIVIDDSTPDMDDGKDMTPRWFRMFQADHANITFIHSDIPYKSGNQMFNLGLSHGNSRFVATIMSSVVVEPDWDVVPVQMMVNNPKIGITGMKCLKMGWANGQDGQIESAGINMNGFTPFDSGRDEPGHRRAVSYPCFSIQWAFALLRREAVVGNLDENLMQGFVGFDDIDNTIYLRYKGWEAWYCGLGAGYHRTHSTRGYKSFKGSNEDEKIFKNKMNAEIFYKRWGYWDLYKEKNPYALEYFPNGKVKFLANANELPLRIPDASNKAD